MDTIGEKRLAQPGEVSVWCTLNEETYIRRWRWRTCVAAICPGYGS
ncbi:hypothetical protein FHR33_008603 [Nonomuraea dietziae]|uniref:Uncharacterized protein n=1 Tax=Nonomuraea dietziae TaxID=65515 RepID=A0A7W5YFC0_9ACTN|nr:hypothetical protein [Nonomuraea dietziae]